MGIETEYGLMCASTEGGTPPLDPEETAAELFRAVLESGLSTNAFLANGARLYLDVGAHPEYATAECRTVADLVAHDRAGELLFAGMAAEANERLAARGVPGRIHLFKNNLDAAGNSYGCHENYLVRRRPDYRARISTMLPFFVTRQIVAGAGCLRRGEDGVTRFAFSQRADQMWDAISSASTRSRPMINTRDEPHGDPELYRRMHVIVGDSNVAEPATALKVAATEALLVLVEDGAVLLDDISLEVASGEILGVAGVQGNGQTELGEVVLGLTRPTAGSIRFGERDVTRLGVHRRLGAGLGFVPEDRSTSGMIADFSVAENMILDRYDDPAFGTGPALSPARIRANAQRLREEFDVRVTDVADPISTLSGGNQQKAILARELSRDLRVLVACQPTRGLDVGSIEFVHGRIVAERDDNGTAVLIISSELDEIYSLSDRIAVMYRGRIVGVVGPDTPRDVLGLMMAGIPGDEALVRRDDADAPSTSATSTEESR